MQNSLITDNLDIKIRIGTMQFEIFLASSLIRKDGPVYAQKHNHSSYEIHFIIAIGTRLKQNQYDEYRMRDAVKRLNPPVVNQN